MFDTNKLFNLLSVMWLRALMVKYCDICVVTSPSFLPEFSFMLQPLNTIKHVWV